MLKTLFSALAALALLVAPVAQAQVVRDVDPALWVIKNADTTIYLFGTVHMMKPGIGWFDDAVRTAFDASDELVLEVIEPSQAVMREIVMRVAVNGEGPPLTMRLPEGRRADFGRVLGGFGMPATALDRFKPWFAAVMIGTLPVTRLGFDPALGVDHVLAEAARSGGKTVIGLETPEEQFGLLDAAPEAAQITYLLTVMDTVDQVGPTVDRMLEMWAAGDADGLGAMLNAEMANNPALAKRFIFDRNERWAEWIFQRMKRPGTVFFAVGGGHLGGPGNVRDLLAKRGVTVQRIAY